jgi:16S rRNA (uracil1498-N3)-methyltransferase
MNEQYRDRTRRLGVETLPPGGGLLTLPEQAARHLRVLRLKTGAEVELGDGRGNQARARIVSIGKKRVVCEVEKPDTAPEERARVVLVQAVPKGAKLQGMVRALTELGVHAVHLALCERGVPKPETGRWRVRLERLERVAREACVQSGRARAPLIVAPAPLLEAAGRAPAHARRVVFWEGSEQDLDSALRLSPGVRGRPLQDREAWLVVGPEGGLSESEVMALSALRYRQASLGPSLLRVETAATVACALVLDRLGRLG